MAALEGRMREVFHAQLGYEGKRTCRWSSLNAAPYPLSATCVDGRERTLLAQLRTFELPLALFLGEAIPEDADWHRDHEKDADANDVLHI